MGGKEQTGLECNNGVEISEEKEEKEELWVGSLQNGMETQSGVRACRVRL